MTGDRGQLKPSADSGSKRERHAARPEASQGPEMQLCANRRAGLKEATSVAAVDEASQRRDVVEDPERAAVGSRHQVCSLDLQIVNRGDRQAPAHAHPALSVIQAAKTACREYWWE